MKKCAHCCLEKSLEEFNRFSRSPDGRQAYCKICQRERQSQYYTANKKAINSRTVQNRQVKKHLEANRRWREANPEKYKESWRRNNKKFRLKVLDIVGKGELRCVRCGCDQPELLEINHINGGGAKEVKHRNQEFYGKIVRGERKVDDLELLCKPCNNLHYLELKYGSLPFKITWEARDGQGAHLQ